MQRLCVIGLILIVLNAASCGGEAAADSCGQVQPCGGDVRGTWDLSSYCQNESAPVAGTPIMALCPMATVSIVGGRVEGALTYNADGTYSETSKFTADALWELPSSCFKAGSCSDLEATLRKEAADSGDMVSFSCSGSSVCSCHAVGPTPPTNETGRYEVSGTVLKTTPTVQASSTTSFCVQGNLLHLLGLDGGKVAVDIVGRKR